MSCAPSNFRHATIILIPLRAVEVASRPASLIATTRPRRVRVSKRLLFAHKNRNLVSISKVTSVCILLVGMDVMSLKVERPF